MTFVCDDKSSVHEEMIAHGSDYEMPSVFSET